MSSKLYTDDIGVPLNTFVYFVGLVVVAEATYPDIDIELACSMVQQEFKIEPRQVVQTGYVEQVSSCCGGGTVR